MGFIDTTGEWIFRPQFSHAESFKYGLSFYSFEGGNSYGYVNKYGKVYDEPEYYTEQCSVKQINGIYGIFDSTGTVLVPPKFQFIGPFVEGRAKVKVENKWGFIRHSGEYLCPPQYDDVCDFSSGMAAVRKGENWGYIDTSGSLVIPIEYGDAQSFQGFLGSVTLLRKIRLDGRDHYLRSAAYISKEGKVVWAAEKEE